MNAMTLSMTGEPAMAAPCFPWLNWGRALPIGAAQRSAPTRLFTATCRIDGEDYEIEIFHACHATSRSEVLGRVSQRIPAKHLGLVEVVDGIDVDHPIVRRIVPEALRDRLAEIGDCCPNWRSLETGGDIHIVERRGG
ncbi:hypothetical protein [uncultured Sphingomonas sp.]|uniref:hypothetical protein n=1 Tax=uncultured Sphingomonas sp. TaxID=158754 RepID=UPI0025EF93A8|nr:hypothetical protein [uncultured Sphingomonas sp.]